MSKKLILLFALFCTIATYGNEVEEGFVAVKQQYEQREKGADKALQEYLARYPYTTYTDEVKTMLGELRPMLQQDGGDLEFIKMEGKVVTLKLVGHCGTCPYAMMTLKQGIESRLQLLDPEITVERAEA